MPQGILTAIQRATQNRLARVGGVTIAGLDGMSLDEATENNSRLELIAAARVKSATSL